MTHRDELRTLLAAQRWQDAHRLLYSKGRKLGQIPLLSPITYHELEGAVYCVLSWTQIDFCGLRSEWRPSPHFQAVADLAGEFR